MATNKEGMHPAGEDGLETEPVPQGWWKAFHET
jgi:hypothetical protein